jgi:hypothetical protein
MGSELVARELTKSTPSRHIPATSFLPSTSTPLPTLRRWPLSDSSAPGCPTSPPAERRSLFSVPRCFPGCPTMGRPRPNPSPGGSRGTRGTSAPPQDHGWPPSPGWPACLWSVAIVQANWPCTMALTVCGCGASGTSPSSWDRCPKPWPRHPANPPAPHPQDARERLRFHPGRWPAPATGRARPADNHPGARQHSRDRSRLSLALAPTLRFVAGTTVCRASRATPHFARRRSSPPQKAAVHLARFARRHLWNHSIPFRNSTQRQPPAAVIPLFCCCARFLSHYDLFRPHVCFIIVVLTVHAVTTPFCAFPFPRVTPSIPMLLPEATIPDDIIQHQRGHCMDRLLCQQ